MPLKIAFWDLDNTLWDGIVYDNNEIKKNEMTCAVLKELHKRGIKNIIISKNNEEKALPFLEKFNLMRFVDDYSINWGPKGHAIKSFLKKFSILSQDAIFIDDQAFERAEVLFEVPNIKTISPEESESIFDLLNLNTNEDKERLNLIRGDISRKKNQDNNNFKEFLKQSELKLRIRKADEEDLLRVSQLINRTNELNVTVNRETLEEIKEGLMKGNEIIVADLKDVYGDYGLIAAVIIKKTESWFIQNLTVSCRAMGRGIGKAILIYVMNLAKGKTKRLHGYVRKTDDNWRIIPLYEKRGFKKLLEKDNLIEYYFDFTSEIPSYPEFLETSF